MECFVGFVEEKIFVAVAVAVAVVVVSSIDLIRFYLRK
jgi:hypothetical protein